jgi:hypothetical protein
MTDQPVPHVTDDDVKRVAVRDFGTTQADLALSIVEEFGKQDWNRPSPRVWLAILKLANGDLDRLREITATAIPDYRDVLALAEYPRYSREIGFLDDPESTKQAAIDDDWKQYCRWLGRDASDGREDA